MKVTKRNSPLSLKEQPKPIGRFVSLLTFCVGSLFSAAVLISMLWISGITVPKTWTSLRTSMYWVTTRPFSSEERVNPRSLHSSVRSASALYDVPEELIWAVITVESNFNVRARSRVGAMGLMQLMPGTAEMLKVRNPYHAHDNIHGGTKYLRQMLNLFHGDMRKAVAAYNAGPATVKRYRGVPPYPETRRYVNRVLKLYEGQKKGDFSVL